VNGTPTLVTGASGFIGGWVSEQLHLGGAMVRAGVRNWSNAARIARFPFEIVSCDVLDPGSLAKAVAGVDHVVHCAVGDAKVIITGTRNVLEAASNAGVRRVIFLSSAEVYGAHTAGVIDESAELAGGNPYADAKAAAESICREYSNKLEIVVLRPSIVYGPYGGAWTEDMARRLLSGSWGSFGELGNGYCNLVYVTDLVRAIHLSLLTPAAAGRTFNITGPDDITWNEYFELFANAIGARTAQPRSGAAVRLEAALTSLARKPAIYVAGQLKAPLQELAKRSPLVRRSLRGAKEGLNNRAGREELESLYSRRARYPAALAGELLEWEPRVTVEEGLLLVREWLIHSGVLATPTVGVKVNRQETRQAPLPGQAVER